MPDAPRPARRYSWRLLPWRLIALLLFAGAVRGGVLWAQFDHLRQDPDRYAVFAENLLRWGVFSSDPRPDDFVEDARDLPEPSAFRPPLYPYLLANVHRGLRSLTPVRIAVCHWLLGMATVWLVRDLGRRWQLGAMADLAALITACDPILLQQSTLIMTETLAAFLTVVALWSLTRYSQQPEAFRALLAGGAIGLATLCRPTYLPWLGLVGMLLVVGSRPPLRSRLIAAVALVLGGLALLLPWGLRNQREVGVFTVTTTHGGYTLWLGNNAEFYALLRRGEPLTSYQPKPPGFMQSIGDTVPFDVRADEVNYAAAREAIGQEPGMFVVAGCYRLYQLVNPLPHATEADESTAKTGLRYAVAAWYLAVYLLAGFGLFKLRREFWKAPWVWGFALCLAFVGVHALYWTNLRMRGPLMPFLALVAAAGAAHLAEPFAHANLLRRKNLRSC